MIFTRMTCITDLPLMTATGVTGQAPKRGGGWGVAEQPATLLSLAGIDGTWVSALTAGLATTAGSLLRELGARFKLSDCYVNLSRAWFVS